MKDTKIMILHSSSSIRTSEQEGEENNNQSAKGEDDVWKWVQSFFIINTTTPSRRRYNIWLTTTTTINMNGTRDINRIIQCTSHQISPIVYVDWIVATWLDFTRTGMKNRFLNSFHKPTHILCMCWFYFFYFSVNFYSVYARALVLNFNFRYVIYGPIVLLVLLRSLSNPNQIFFSIFLQFFHVTDVIYDTTHNLSLFSSIKPFEPGIICKFQQYLIFLKN